MPLRLTRRLPLAAVNILKMSIVSVEVIASSAVLVPPKPFVLPRVWAVAKVLSLSILRDSSGSIIDDVLLRLSISGAPCLYVFGRARSALRSSSREVHRRRSTRPTNRSDRTQRHSATKQLALALALHRTQASC